MQKFLMVCFGRREMGKWKGCKRWAKKLNFCEDWWENLKKRKKTWFSLPKARLREIVDDNHFTYGTWEWVPRMLWLESVTNWIGKLSMAALDSWFHKTASFYMLNWFDSRVGKQMKWATHPFSWHSMSQNACITVKFHGMSNNLNYWTNEWFNSSTLILLFKRRVNFALKLK